ncbi:PRC-barrel domain containing protein [Lampropedia aestuarii]|uniref:PRC-barrel domain containing protein n=1 Tax=Lampropedia aestuarii TaxID=2562762 RepID=A0A4S5BR06_9BURK|nr:PRC-barrel domain-containing protein [Lampropedia aestuarii]THJ32126.1 PRC-barrel domain containing protein [Lampropedia aestuarii]
MSERNANLPLQQGHQPLVGGVNNPVAPAQAGNAANQHGSIGGAAYGEYEKRTPSFGNNAADIQAIATGWSLKDSILGQSVYNESGETVGKIEDVIIAVDSSATFAVIGVGGFLGIGTHDVTIAVRNFHIAEGRIVLPGATQEALKEIPESGFVKK